MPFTDDMIAKYLQDPLSFPPEFKSWFVKYLEQHQPSLQAGLLAGKLPTSKLTGQIPYSQLTLANSIVSGDIVDGTIVNADINTAAAIAVSKLAAYPGSAAKVLAGDGTWPGGVVSAYDSGVLGAAVGTIDTLAVLPTTFAWMRIVLYGRSDAAAVDTGVLARFNNDSTGIYYSETLDSFATSVASTEYLAQTAATVGRMPANTANSLWFGTTEIVIGHYGGTTNAKSFVANSAGARTTASGNIVLRQACGLWANASAINRVTLIPGAGNFAAGTRMTIYVMGA